MYISFPWKLRRVKKVDPLKAKSQSSKYHEKERKQNPLHYQALLQKDRERKKAAYRSASVMSENEADQQRES